MGRRVVVTGMGALSPCGLDVESTWAAMVQGRSGVGPITQSLATADARTAQLLQFYYFDDLTLREIGQMMGVHEATISRWLARAHRG